MINLYTLQPTQIVLYGTSWCSDCRRARSVLDENRIAYLDIDIEADENAMTFVQELNHGDRSVPTIIFPDGTMLVEPGRGELLEKLTSGNFSK